MFKKICAYSSVKKLNAFPVNTLNGHIANTQQIKNYYTPTEKKENNTALAEIKIPIELEIKSKNNDPSKFFNLNIAIQLPTEITSNTEKPAQKIVVAPSENIASLQHSSLFKNLKNTDDNTMSKKPHYPVEFQGV